MTSSYELEIFAACHTPPCRMPVDYLVPLQVGAAIRPQFLELTDSSGDNISARNMSFCELTGLYWIWKNSRARYLGLCHYRRYFDISPDEALQILKRGFVIIPPRITLSDSIQNQYLNNHESDPWWQMIELLKARYPVYYQTSRSVFHQNKLHPFNMFIGTREFLNEYCQWLFEILFRVEKAIQSDQYSEYQARYPGFLAERLFALFIHQKRDLFFEVSVIEPASSLKERIMNHPFVLEFKYQLKKRILY